MTQTKNRYVRFYANDYNTEKGEFTPPERYLTTLRQKAKRHGDKIVVDMNDKRDTMVMITSDKTLGQIRKLYSRDFDEAF